MATSPKKRRGSQQVSDGPIRKKGRNLEWTSRQKKAVEELFSNREKWHIFVDGKTFGAVMLNLTDISFGVKVTLFNNCVHLSSSVIGRDTTNFIVYNIWRGMM